MLAVALVKSPFLIKHINDKSAKQASGASIDNSGSSFLFPLPLALTAFFAPHSSKELFIELKELTELKELIELKELTKLKEL